MTDTLVDIEWIGGPLDGRITRQLRADLKPGMVAWHEEAGVRNNYRLECESGLERQQASLSAPGLPTHHFSFNAAVERWVYRHVKAKGRKR